MGFQNYKHINPISLCEALGGDTDAVVSLAQTFLDSAPDVFIKLQEGIESADPKTVRYESHTLKGMAGILGADGFASTLQRIERATRNGEIPSESEHRELLSQFKLTLAEVLHYVQNAPNA
jgi:HPt (histidine-containing phosphotransfer) domain-containing protein